MTQNKQHASNNLKEDSISNLASFNKHEDNSPSIYENMEQDEMENQNSKDSLPNNSSSLSGLQKSELARFQDVQASLEKVGVVGQNMVREYVPYSK
jgi:hypothetical protein